MYKALITDLDGTAIGISSDGSDIDSKTIKAVQSAIKNGKKLTCATGREWELTKPIVKILGFISPCIIEGGTRIIDPQTEKTVWEKSFANNVPNLILQIFKSETSKGLIMHSSNISRQPLSEIDYLPASLRFLYLLGIQESTAIALSNKINATQDAVAHFTPSWEGEGLVDLHVTDPEATKEHAIKVWQELTGVTKEETIGMGDSGNDVPIFQSSGYKVAVGNATSDLKELADYVAPSVTEHPLVHVIESLLNDA